MINSNKGNKMKKTKQWKQQRLYIKRNKKKIKRKLKKILSREKQIIPKISKEKKEKKEKVLKVIIPKIFSLYENPDEALKKCMNFYKSDSPFIFDEVFFDFFRCEKIDLASSTLLSICSQIKAEEIKHNEKKIINISGCDPVSPKAKLTVNSVGIKKNFGFALSKSVNDQNVDTFDLLKGGKSNVYLNVDEMLESSVASTRITDFYRKILNKHSFDLNIEGRRIIQQLTNEVIDNCIQHADPERKNYQWFVNAYHYLENEKLSSISIVIINFGKTIAESINDLLQKNTSDKNIKKLRRQINLWSSKNQDKLTGKIDLNSLYTLYALQDGVSGKLSDLDPTRGRGTIKLIETFQNLGDSLDESLNPQMCIISGDSYIRFTKDYKIKKMANGRKIIAFNKNNNLNILPDENNVFKLKSFFPGTIISMDFYFDENYIISKKKEIKNEN